MFETSPSESILIRYPNYLHWLNLMQRSSDSTLSSSHISLLLISKWVNSFQPLLLIILSFIQSLPTTHDHRWGLERVKTGKLTALPFGSAHVFPTKTSTESALQQTHQSIFQPAALLCHYSWSRPQDTWTSELFPTLEVVNPPFLGFGLWPQAWRCYLFIYFASHSETSPGPVGGPGSIFRMQRCHFLSAILMKITETMYTCNACCLHVEIIYSKSLKSWKSCFHSQVI